MDLSNFVSLKSLKLSKYLINENGDLYSLKSNKILKKEFCKNGYLSYKIRNDDNILKHYLEHRLVAEGFIEKIEGKNIINHKDFNKKNNNYKNLEWCNISENSKHSYTNGRKSPMFNKQGKRGAENVTSRKIICLNDNKIFDCITDASKYYNIDRSNISKVCNGKFKNNKGFVFKYL